MPPEKIILYATVVFSATIVPGPSMILALRHGMLYGTRLTLISGLGNMLANTIMALISVIGLSAVILASAAAFNVIKWGGALYLIYLGLSAWFSKASYSDVDCSANHNKTRSVIQLFSEGFLVAASNPKGIVFFTALFPQFIDLKHGSSSSITIAFLYLSLTAIGCYMLYALFGKKLQQILKNRKSYILFNRISGSVLFSFGVLLLFKNK